MPKNQPSQDKKPIEQPKTPSLPETWPSLIVALVTSPKLLVLTLGTVFLVLGLAYGVLRLLGYDPLATYLKKPAVTASDSSLVTSIEEAKKLSRPYLILSLTVFVRYEDLTQEGAKQPKAATKRIAHVRTVYTLQMLRKITKNDTLFKEQYGSSYARQIQHWYGTEQEIFHGAGSVYDVLFDANEGELRTVVTGATYIYDLPLPNNRNAFAQNINLSSREDTYAYPNSEDVIREITMILETKNIPIRPVGQASKRVLPNRTLQVGDAKLNGMEGEPETRSLSATWNNIMPNEEVGIHFTW